ncbi:ABC transporter permease [Bordetella parapertussis]|uniref:ABC transporter permease n=1 Tax=Bordetella parapertussis TaxID=519 RepID=UPI001E53C056|nr:ABC transporter permease subunit [Bordetella parapertussis]
MLVGGSLAVVVARCSFPLAGLVAALPLVTLVIPDVVVAASWVLILGRQGLLNGWLEPLGIQLPALYSWWGLVYVMTLNNYVYAFVAVLVGMKSMDRNLEEAALSLGRPEWQVLRCVTFPLLLPSVFAGALMVFTHVIGSFGVPAILGARTPVLAVKAYNEFVSEMGGNPQMQTTMA